MYIRGYEVSDGYMGRAFGAWRWFKSEEAFRAHYKHARKIWIWRR